MRGTAQVFFHQAPVENIVPCWHRGVGSKHGAGRYQLHGGGNIKTPAHKIGAALQQLKSGVALVDMPHSGVQAQGPQRTHTAHPQHQFLLQAHFPVTAV